MFHEEEDKGQGLGGKSLRGKMAVLTCEYCGEPIKRGECRILDNPTVYIHQKCEEEYNGIEHDN